MADWNVSFQYVKWMLRPLNYFVAFCLMLKFPLSALSAFSILSLLIVAAEINQLLMMFNCWHWKRTLTNSRLNLSNLSQHVNSESHSFLDLNILTGMFLDKCFGSWHFLHCECQDYVQFGLHLLVFIFCVSLQFLSLINLVD